MVRLSYLGFQDQLQGEMLVEVAVPCKNKERLISVLIMSNLTNQKPFIISVSARALFNLEKSHRIFQEQGMDAYAKYQLENEDVLLEPGPAYPLVQKICDLNKRLPPGTPPIEVILLSRNSAETGLRVFNTIEKMGLDIERAVFTSGTPSSTYIHAIGAQLFLSSNPEEVTKALKAGIGAATLMPMKKSFEKRQDNQIRIAFDGDAVLFSDEAERIHHERGLEGFHRHEADNALTPLQAGPMKPFLEMIHRIQDAFPPDDCPIRTALVTARAAPAHKRAILTLRNWGVRIDESMFLGGRPKAPILKAFGTDLFLDDSTQNIELALDDVPSGHVPHGIRNEANADESRFTGGVVAVAPIVEESAVRTSRPRMR